MSKEEFRIKFSEGVAEYDGSLCEMADGSYPEISNGGLAKLTDIAEATAEPLFTSITELLEACDAALLFIAQGAPKAASEALLTAIDKAKRE